MKTTYRAVALALVCVMAFSLPLFGWGAIGHIVTGSHKPCAAAQRQNPPRRSIWKIHPIYSVDVCKKTTLDACPTDDETNWVPLQDWTGADSNEESTDGSSN